MYKELLDYFMEAVQGMAPEQIEKLSEDILADMEKTAFAKGKAVDITGNIMNDIRNVRKQSRAYRRRAIERAMAEGVDGLTSKGLKANAGRALLNAETSHGKELADAAKKHSKELENAKKELDKIKKDLGGKINEIGKKDTELLKQKHLLEEAQRKGKVYRGAAGVAGAAGIAALAGNRGYRSAREDDKDGERGPIINKY